MWAGLVGNTVSTLLSASLLHAKVVLASISIALAVRRSSHCTRLKSAGLIAEAMELDYGALTERTRETVMNYAAEQWPLYKSSVRDYSDWRGNCMQALVP